VWGDAGVVGMDRESVYTLGGARADRIDKGGPALAKNSTYTRESFLKALQEALQVIGERRGLVALPPSATRAAKLVDFVLKHGAEKTAIGREADYRVQLSAVSHAMAPISPAEQTVLVQRIRDIAEPEDKAMLLELAGSIPVGKDAFGELSGWIDRARPPVVRRAAMRAISRIDPYAASERIAPLLSVKEPELRIALEALGGISYPPRDAKLSLKVVDALLDLATEMKDWPAGASIDSTNAHFGLTHQLHHYAHPRLIGALYDAALNSSDSTREQSVSDLREVTGLKWERAQKDQWEAWWTKARPVLEATYDLGKPDGLAAWLAAYASADEATQRILLRLWVFQEAIDEAALIAAATAKGNPAGAVATLAELWRLGRLSGDAMRQIFDAFVTIEMVEGPPQPQDPARRDLSFFGSATFPFPSGVSVQYRYSIGVGKEPALPATFDNSASLDRGAKISLGSLSTPARGQPQAKGLLEIRQVDYQHDQQVIWSTSRAFGPILLRQAE
jgi:hypothetical protein